MRGYRDSYKNDVYAVNKYCVPYRNGRGKGVLCGNNGIYSMHDPLGKTLCLRLTLAAYLPSTTYGIEIGDHWSPSAVVSSAQ